MTFIPRFSCPKRWQDMAGDERERFCEHCQSSVYNLELMSPEERLLLMSRKEGHACGRYRIAIRRAMPGYERQYMRHLLTHGVGIGAVSGALLTFWQLWGPIAAAPNPGATNPVADNYFVTASTPGDFPMPRQFIESLHVHVLGGIAFCAPDTPREAFVPIDLPEVSPLPIRITFDPKSILPGVESVHPIETIPGSVKRD